jgi:hypothetical protein
MSKIKIQGNATGTGVLTVTAPNSNTDRTITLPDGDVTLGAATPSITDNGNATAITIDSSENVGIGVTPESWFSSVDALQVASSGALFGRNNEDNRVGIASNAYETSSNVWKRIGNSGSAFANLYETDNGKHLFKVAPSGTADSAISWTTALQLTNDGRGLSQFTAKAWVNFDGTTNVGGNCTINDAHNISSVADRGVGKYTLNFSNSLANTNYACFGFSCNSTIDNSTTDGQTFNNRATGSVRMSNAFVESNNHGFYDRNTMGAIIFGD